MVFFDANNGYIPYSMDKNEAEKSAYNIQQLSDEVLKEVFEKSQFDGAFVLFKSTVDEWCEFLEKCGGYKTD